MASGYQGVWAKENTREAIWDAMKRKETYATTGPRMIVRFFGGWDFTEKDPQNRLPAYVGYTKGVPMGAKLPAGARGRAPSFLVATSSSLISVSLRSRGLGPGHSTEDTSCRCRIALDPQSKCMPIVDFA